MPSLLRFRGRCVRLTWINLVCMEACGACGLVFVEQRSCVRQLRCLIRRPSLLTQPRFLRMRRARSQSPAATAKRKFIMPSTASGGNFFCDFGGACLGLLPACLVVARMPCFALVAPASPCFFVSCSRISRRGPCQRSVFSLADACDCYRPSASLVCRTQTRSVFFAALCSPIFPVVCEDSFSVLTGGLKLVSALFLPSPRLPRLRVSW
jgi:hypothetical protein